jgi:hypothetical protein
MRSRFALPLLAAAAASTLAWAAPARACSVCGCGDPLLSSSDPAAITGQLRLQLDTEYLGIDAGSEETPGATDQLAQWSTRLNAVWRPLDDLALSATLPYVSKTIRTVGGGATVTASDLSGLGDVELGVRWTAWRSVQVGARRVQELALSAGSTLPTGQKQAKEAGALIDPHGQVGTGGWGPFAGAHYRYEQGDWSAFASLSYRVRTEASYFDGTRYKFGDAVLWSVHGQYLAAKRLALDLGLDGRRAAADRATDETGAVDGHVVNTGGTVVAAAPGVYFNATGGLWLFARGQLPVVKRLEGEQDVMPTFTLGLQLQLQ